MLVERIPASASRMRAAVFWVEAPITSTPEALNASRSGRSARVLPAPARPRTQTVPAPSVASRRTSSR